MNEIFIILAVLIVVLLINRRCEETEYFNINSTYTDNNNKSQEDEESIDINHDTMVGKYGETIKPNNNWNNIIINRNTNTHVEKYIDTAMDVLSDIDKFSKTPGSGVSYKCQNLIKLPNKECIKEIKSKIAAVNFLSEPIKNKITKQFKETTWFND
jgi:hypothetical protein